MPTLKVSYTTITHQFNSNVVVIVQVFPYEAKYRIWYIILIKDQSQINVVNTFNYHPHISDYSPNLSSPKFPQPIFLPTLKFGPTMRTPDEDDGFELLTLLLTGFLLGLACRFWSELSLRFPLDAIRWCCSKRIV